MKTITLAVIMLIGSLANAGELRQYVCASIDKNAHDSRWTTRDNTAKLRYLAQRIDAKSQSFITDKNHSVFELIELHYGKPPVCRSLAFQQYSGDNQQWLFTNKIGVGVQYGGDCEFVFNPRKTINVTIHHRRGNLIEPWSCTVK